LASSKKFPWFVVRTLDPETFQIDQDSLRIKLDPSVSARYRPFAGGAEYWKIDPPSTPQELDQGDGLPIPPHHLWAGYCETPQEYAMSGRIHFARMQELLLEAGFRFTQQQRILDFGCAAGRMTRQLFTHAGDSEIWGVDQSGPHIVWCQQYLSPPINFLTSTTYPHLPFEDNYFDLILSGSVFTHIGDLEDAWLMELRRITKPHGFLYVTVADNHTLEILRTSPPGHWLHDSMIRQQLLDFENQFDIKDQDFQLFVTKRAAGNSQVFHNQRYIQEHWGQYLKILSLIPEAYGYQTAVIMQKL
jgi:ubiquinone/menaquinone biosynthesis C-methylase UbiE